MKAAGEGEEVIGVIVQWSCRQWRCKDWTVCLKCQMNMDYLYQCTTCSNVPVYRCTICTSSGRIVKYVGSQRERERELGEGNGDAKAGRPG